MTYKEHRSVDGHKIGFVITMKDTDVFPTMGLCNNAASTICDIIQIDPSCDKNAAAAALQQSVWYGHVSNSDWDLLKIMGRRRFERRDCFHHINMPGGSVRVNSDHNAPGT